MDSNVKYFMYEIFIPSIIILCCVAAFLNFMVVISRLYCKMRSASLELTYSLALSDTWTSIVIGFSLFWNSYKPVVLNIPHSSYCFPLTLEAFRTGGLLTGIFHLVALAFTHYMTIKRPFDHHKVLPIRTIYIMIFFMWATPPMALMIYFASNSGQGYQSEKCMGIKFYENFYFRALVSLIIVFLIILTTIFYIKMLQKITEVRSKTASNSQTLGASARGRRTVVTAVLIFGTFLIGWMPASILYILTAESMPLYNKHSVSITIMSIAVLVSIMAKTLCNPIIYATRIPEINQFVFQKLLYRVLPGRNPTIRRQSELEPLKTRCSQPNAHSVML
ncbi:G-protein coupled receptors family 1 profile domain-containing protein [Caenorhabditis elegans]|uniref:G-protein coupled receptors family 1 profile domain-containing protein n=1 Tax=Caenorhabditis elegans TaxID=6239 RepID=Q17553_CAEEL|nr:G-protein coupled receptors family 1 profile domain-containing protein [Caenorhabditis elegans]CCD62408.1 G-protein coupled receptors family 1 profile domain-containing protein [Caenorhabditis elegans]|eukprot:NP_494751.1 Uncharacterized protein CELE_C01F1.4 [Caenorhabditis elegans]